VIGSSELNIFVGNWIETSVNDNTRCVITFIDPTFNIPITPNGIITNYITVP